MRRSVVILAAVLFVCGAIGVVVLHGVMSGIRDAADHAEVAAAKARVAATRAERVAQAACLRDQDSTDASNRNGAITYLVLRQASRTPGRIPIRTRTRYKVYSQLPLFRPRPDCDKAKANPEYDAGRPRPFAELPYWKVQQALHRGR